jgi:hypothetical protein
MRDLERAVRSLLSLAMLLAASRARAETPAAAAPSRIDPEWADKGLTKCPCLAQMTNRVYSIMDADRKIVPRPVAGGFVVFDATPRFMRWDGDRRGYPCNDEKPCGFVCEDARGPEWTVTPELPACPPPRANAPCRHDDGYQLRIGPLKPGTYTVRAAPRVPFINGGSKGPKGCQGPPPLWEAQSIRVR